MTDLIFDRYGKTAVRLVQVLRYSGTHSLMELNVAVYLTGEFQETYRSGDNSRVLPTDTMKNTVYVVARRKPIDSPEEFAKDLTEHFLSRVPDVEQAKVEIEMKPWNRIGDANAFFLAGQERRTTERIANRRSATVRSGLRDLTILKTSGSGFSGFLRDELTTLQETEDRLLGTSLSAEWSFTQEPAAYNDLFDQVRQTLLDAFASHISLSVQHTLHAMAEAVLKSIRTVDDIHLVMPNKHCLLVDLSKFGLDNPNQVFVPTDEPSGFIEARIKRST